MIRVNPLPRNASIRVLVIVPTMSRPIFMPDLNRSFDVRPVFAACTSSSDEEILMATSITAPRALMMMPATRSPLSPIGCPICLS